MSMNYANVGEANSLLSNAQARAQAAYNDGMLKYNNDRLAFEMAQQAYADAMNQAQAFGYAPGGNWTTWGAGGPTQPIPGTWTQAALQQAYQQGIGAAGLTGYYSNPQTWAYPPGTWIRDSQTGQVGQINGGGMLVTTQNLPPGLDTSQIPQVQSDVFSQLQQGQGSGAGGRSSLGMTQQAIAQQQQQAAQQAGVTGLYNQPMGNIALDAFQKAGPQTQQSYLANSGGDMATAANRYWTDVQGAIQQSGQTAQQFVYGTNGPQASLQMQAMYGQYGVPQQGQETLAANQQYYQQQLDAQRQALAQWQAQQGATQNYLQLLSSLRGPADYAKYQQVLGATPGGVKSLVAAAAGQYIPGGGATTGVQPQAANLNTLYSQATGGADQSSQAAMNTLVAPNQMAPQTWNALTPSQQQMLLGTWESQGYTQEDAKALFQQSLPRYATSAPSAGQFRLQ